MGFIKFLCNPLFEMYKRALNVKKCPYLCLVCVNMHRIDRCIWVLLCYTGGRKRMGFSLLCCYFFLSIINECHPFCSLSLLHASAPASSLFRCYPLYVLSIFFRPSLYITPNTHPHTLLYARFILCDPLSFWTYFIKGLLTGNSHPHLINCC